jgi:hypothetical protein
MAMYPPQAIGGLPGNPMTPINHAPPVVPWQMPPQAIGGLPPTGTPLGSSDKPLPVFPQQRPTDRPIGIQGDFRKKPYPEFPKQGYPVFPQQRQGWSPQQFQGPWPIGNGSIPPELMQMLMGLLGGRNYGMPPGGPPSPGMPYSQHPFHPWYG